MRLLEKPQSHLKLICVAERVAGRGCNLNNEGLGL